MDRKLKIGRQKSVNLMVWLSNLSFFNAAARVFRQPRINKCCTKKNAQENIAGNRIKSFPLLFSYAYSFFKIGCAGRTRTFTGQLAPAEAGIYPGAPTPETGGHGCLISSPHSVVGGSRYATGDYAKFS